VHVHLRVDYARSHGDDAHHLETWCSSARRAMDGSESGSPERASRKQVDARTPSPQRNLHCDVAVLGGRITDALVADELARHDYDGLGRRPNA
jgi:hypothetical protein